jgi:tetratricopeptide (TPR) repeat protein
MKRFALPAALLATLVAATPAPAQPIQLKPEPQPLEQPRAPVRRPQSPAQSAPPGAGFARPLPRLDAAPTAANEYDACMRRAEKEPENAYEDAMGWARARGGAEPALHCAAVALFYAGHYRQAAEAFGDLAGRFRDRRTLLRASLVSQAGRAWLAADEPEKAMAAFDAAIEIAPETPTFRIDRAEAHAAEGKFWEAIDDLNRAIELDPRRGDAFALRASAYRQVDAADLAMEDADNAVKLAPKLPEAWLERGILKRLKGDKNGARRDWREVLLLEPDGQAAETARANIERMELGLEPPAPPAKKQR